MGLAAKPLSWAGISTRHYKSCETGTVATTNEWQRFAAKAGIRVLAGDVTGAQPDAEKARELLEARLRDHPHDFRSLRALSWAYLALDRKADAINTARRAVELLPLEKDAVLGSGNLAALAEMQAQTGASKEAVENLKKLLSIPAGETISIARLKNRSGLGPDPQRSAAFNNCSRCRNTSDPEL